MLRKIGNPRLVFQNVLFIFFFFVCFHFLPFLSLRILTISKDTRGNIDSLRVGVRNEPWHAARIILIFACQQMPDIQRSRYICFKLCTHSLHPLAHSFLYPILLPSLLLLVHLLHPSSNERSTPYDRSLSRA